jgi:hypothetical protein
MAGAKGFEPGKARSSFVALFCEKVLNAADTRRLLQFPSRSDVLPNSPFLGNPWATGAGSSGRETPFANATTVVRVTVLSARFVDYSTERSRLKMPLRRRRRSDSRCQARRVESATHCNRTPRINSVGRCGRSCAPTAEHQRPSEANHP